MLLAVALSPSLRVGRLASARRPGRDRRRRRSRRARRRRRPRPRLASAGSRRGRAGIRRGRAARAPSRPRRCGRRGRAGTRHLALAEARPDAGLTGTAAAAAASAARRGAPQAAVRLAEHALRLTPHDDPDRDSRVLELAGYLLVAGEKRRVTDVLEPQVHSLPRGAMRAQAFLLLSSGEIRGNDDIQRYLELALAESGSDGRARASVLADMAENVAVVRVERIAEADAWALEALPPTPGAPSRARTSRAVRAGLDAEPRRPRDRRRVRALSGGVEWCVPHRVLAGAGRGAAARVARRDRARRGDPEPSARGGRRAGRAVVVRFAAAAPVRARARAGEWDSAERSLDAWAQCADRELLHWPMYERCRALLAAGRGLPVEARRWGTEADERGGGRGSAGISSRRIGRWDGRAAAHETATAAERLRAVGAHASARVSASRARSRSLPRLVEALVELGDLEEAAP